MASSSTFGMNWKADCEQGLIIQHVEKKLHIYPSPIFHLYTDLSVCSLLTLFTIPVIFFCVAGQPSEVYENGRKLP